MPKKLTAFEISFQISQLQSTADRAKESGYSVIRAECKRVIATLQRRLKAAQKREGTK